mgnify:CR=1 FL=1
MESVYPELIEEWHPDNSLKPSEVTKNADVTIKWLCNKCQHEWFATVNNRTGSNKSGCGVCSTGGFNPGKPGFYYSFAMHGPDGIWWYKGGITGDVDQRQYEIQRSLIRNGIPLEMELLEVMRFELGKEAKELEKILLKKKEIRVYTEEKFSGSMELFSVNPISWARDNGLI